MTFMIKSFFLTLLTICSYESISQKLLTSWSQQNIENYTKEMYDEAQKLTAPELLSKNLNTQSWSLHLCLLNPSPQFSPPSGEIEGARAGVTNYYLSHPVFCQFQNLKNIPGK